VTFEENDDPDTPEPPIIRDVRVQKITNPSMVKTKLDILEEHEEVDIDMAGFSPGYYGINIVLNDGQIISESHYIPL
jgi:hypothetical protein